MGYNTAYSLKLTPLEPSEVDDTTIIDEFRSTNDRIKCSLKSDGETENSSSWYDHEKDLKEFSKKYPQWLFTLQGYGEEAGDVWKKYFVSGKVQIAQAVLQIDEFDFNKLG